MLSKFFSPGALVVAGIMLADVLIHPTGSATAFNGAASLEVPAIQGLLGNSPSSVPAAKG